MKDRRQRYLNSELGMRNAERKKMTEDREQKSEYELMKVRLQNALWPAPAKFRNQ